MKSAFLPNYFKRIGILCFFIAVAGILTMSALHFKDMYAAHSAEIEASQDLSLAFQLGKTEGQKMAEENALITRACSILLLLGIAFYMMAKEKIDDEYMDVIRWESFRLALLLSIAFTLVCVALGITPLAKILLFVQFFGYLIVFKIKKSQLS